MSNNINIKVNAIGNFSQLETEIAKLQKTISLIQSKPLLGSSGDEAVANIKKVQNRFDQMVLATRAYNVELVKSADHIDQLATNLERGKLKLNDYYQLWSQRNKTAFSEINELVDQQARLSKSFFVPDALRSGYSKAITNLTADLKSLGAEQEASMIRMKVMNSVVRGLGTELINLGKNTQWTGRQLTVGLTVPLASFAAMAAKQFREVNAELTKMQRMYGTGIIPPSHAEIDRVSKQVMQLSETVARNMGIVQSETVRAAAEFSAVGLMGDKLINATEQAMRLSKLGAVNAETSQRTIVSLQTVFRVGSKDLKESVDFLNDIQKQTSTDIQDLTDAIPRVGPIIQQLGGTYKDAAVMMVAMKEAGIPAAQSANAIKSAVASIIGPTKQATDEFAKFGISLSAIKDNTAGNPIKMIEALQQALQNLDPLTQAQLVEKLFGKFQFARVTALLNNMGRAGSQTQNALMVANASAKQLATLADQELKVATESVSARYERAMAGFKASLMPIGEAATKVATVFLNAFTKVSQFFDKLGPLKNIITGALGGTAVVGPILMLTGLMGNLIGSMIKGFNTFRMFKEGFSGGGGLMGGLRGIQNYFEKIDLSSLAAAQNTNTLESNAEMATKAFQTLNREVQLLENRLRDIALHSTRVLPPSSYESMSQEELTALSLYESQRKQQGGERPHYESKANAYNRYISNPALSPELQRMEAFYISQGGERKGKEQFRRYFEEGQMAQYTMVPEGSAAGLLQRKYGQTPVIYGGKSGQSKEEVFSRETERLLQIHDEIISGKISGEQKAAEELRRILGSSSVKGKTLEAGQVEALQRIVAQVTFSEQQVTQNVIENLTKQKAVLMGSESDIVGLNKEIARIMTTGDAAGRPARVAAAWNTFVESLSVDAIAEIQRYKSAITSELLSSSDPSQMLMIARNREAELGRLALEAGGAKRLAMGPGETMGAQRIKSSIVGYGSAITGKIGFQTGGSPWVPGSGDGDKVPAMLEPGEFVVNRNAAKQYGGLLHDINFNKAPRFQIGGWTQKIQSVADEFGSTGKFYGDRFSSALMPIEEFASLPVSEQKQYLNYIENLSHTRGKLNLTAMGIAQQLNLAHREAIFGKPKVVSSQLSPLYHSGAGTKFVMNPYTGQMERLPESIDPFTGQPEGYYGPRPWKDYMVAQSPRKGRTGKTAQMMFSSLQSARKWASSPEQNPEGFSADYQWGRGTLFGRNVSDPKQKALEYWAAGHQGDFRAPIEKGIIGYAKSLMGLMGPLSGQDLVRSTWARYGYKNINNVRTPIESQFGPGQEQQIVDMIHSGKFAELSGMPLDFKGLSSWADASRLSSSYYGPSLFSRLKGFLASSGWGSAASIKKKLKGEMIGNDVPLLLRLLTAGKTQGVGLEGLVKEPTYMGQPLDLEFMLTREHVLKNPKTYIDSVSSDLKTRLLQLNLVERQKGGGIPRFINGGLFDLFQSIMSKRGGNKQLGPSKKWDPNRVIPQMPGQNELLNNLFDRSGKPHMLELRQKVLEEIINSSAPDEQKMRMLSSLNAASTFSELEDERLYASSLGKAFSSLSPESKSKLSATTVAHILTSIMSSERMINVSSLQGTTSDVLPTITKSGSGKRSRPSQWSRYMQPGFEHIYGGVDPRDDMYPILYSQMKNLGYSDFEIEKALGLSLFGRKGKYRDARVVQASHFATGGGIPGFAYGGTPWVPGSGEGDRIPAMLEPGEFVVNKKAAMQYGGLLNHINWNAAPRFAEGTGNRQSRRASIGKGGVDPLETMAQVQANIDEFSRLLPSKIVSQIATDLHNGITKIFAGLKAAVSETSASLKNAGDTVSHFGTDIVQSGKSAGKGLKEGLSSGISGGKSSLGGMLEKVTGKLGGMLGGGGMMSKLAFNPMVGMAAQAVTPLIMGGVQKLVGKNQVAGGAVSGMQAGVQLGSMFGPYGMAIGAAGGALVGGIKSFLDVQKQRSEQTLAGIKQATTMSAEQLDLFGVKIRDFSNTTIKASNNMDKAQTAAQKNISIIAQSIKNSEDPDVKAATKKIQDLIGDKDYANVEKIMTAKYSTALMQTGSAEKARQVVVGEMRGMGISSADQAQVFDYGKMKKTSFSGAFNQTLSLAASSKDKGAIGTSIAQLVQTAPFSKLSKELTKVGKEARMATLLSGADNFKAYNAAVAQTNPKLADLNSKLSELGINNKNIILLNGAQNAGFKATGEQLLALSKNYKELNGVSQIYSVVSEARTALQPFIDEANKKDQNYAVQKQKSLQGEIDGLNKQVKSEENLIKANEKKTKAIQKEIDARQKLWDKKQQQVQQDQTLNNLAKQVNDAQASGDLIGQALAMSSYNQELKTQNELKAKQAKDDADQSRINRLQISSEKAQEKIDKLTQKINDLSQAQQDAGTKATTYGKDATAAVQTVLDKLGSGDITSKGELIGALKDAGIKTKDIGRYANAITKSGDFDKLASAATTLQKALKDNPKLSKDVFKQQLILARAMSGKQLNQKDLDQIDKIVADANQIGKTGGVGKQKPPTKTGYIAGYGLKTGTKVERHSDGLWYDKNKNKYSAWAVYQTLSDAKNYAKLLLNPNADVTKPIPYGDKAWATGGYVSGPGNGTSDSIPARLSNGEYVVKASAVSRVGKGFLDGINNGYASGGFVGGGNMFNIAKEQVPLFDGSWWKKAVINPQFKIPFLWWNAVVKKIIPLFDRDWWKTNTFINTIGSLNSANVAKKIVPFFDLNWWKSFAGLPLKPEDLVDISTQLNVSDLIDGVISALNVTVTNFPAIQPVDWNSSKPVNVTNSVPVTGAFKNDIQAVNWTSAKPVSLSSAVAITGTVLTNWTSAKPVSLSGGTGTSATAPLFARISKVGTKTDGFARGGYISGDGGPTSDMIPAMLSNGEYVVRASSVASYGKGMLDAINNRKFATGGLANRYQIGGPVESGNSSFSDNSVYNINITAATNANPDDIAQAVMKAIERDKKSLSTNRYTGSMR